MMRALCLILLLFASLAGCSGSTPPTPEEAANTRPLETPGASPSSSFQPSPPPP
jgi:hypothetical protein